MISPNSAPRLRPDVFLVPSGSGTAYVRSSRGTELIATPGIAGWIDRLTPFLDGTRTVAQLLDGLDDTRRPLILGVLRRLDEHGLLEDRADPGPARRAAAHPELRVLILATARGGRALDGALRLTGVRATTLVTDPAEARAAATAGRHDVLLLLTAGDDPPLVAALDERCREQGLWFAAAVSDADAWWLGPVLGPGPAAGLDHGLDHGLHHGLDHGLDRVDGGWLGAWLRVHGGPLDGRAPGTAAAAARSAEGVEGVEVAAALLAHHFQQTFLTQDQDAADQLVRLDRQTLTTTRHRYQPHPAARPAAPSGESEFLAVIEALRGGPAVGPEEFSRRAALCIDPLTGLIAELDEGGLPQFPRHSSTALVRDPRTGRAGHRVHATGADFAAARVRTARRALERYAHLAADPRRYVPTSDGPAVRAWSPERRTTRLLPAASVFAHGRRAVRGLGSGTTFDEAVEAARRDLPAAARGGTVLIVPLDHDPAATRVLPYLVKAVGCDD
ncbi:hypothetical protein OG455_00800 [Kitasatospora sp. NBC_01287]|uniref:hypothetical protein n=1 Tax=Kitasatospora sp. NBC_01287 TaxID=2903573 RepID=UPI002254B518|nr:hypothetical protein [Kitasatospora sp. NBC_01287]MCX4744063.1 hypothetical protein [Kitasatospora sp. NBC_01287]